MFNKSPEFSSLLPGISLLNKHHSPHPKKQCHSWLDLVEESINHWPIGTNSIVCLFKVRNIKFFTGDPVHLKKKAEA